MNEALFVFTIILCFSTTVIIYKKMGKTGLFIWVVLASIISNIQTVKLVNLFGIETALGTVMYGSLFLANDILSEQYGKKEAIKTIYLGFLAMIIMTIFMGISLLYVPSSSDFANESLKTIFTLNIRITLGSLIGFSISQFIDATIYELLNNRKCPIWIKNNVSTIISQLFDTIIFCTVTYFGTISFPVLFSIMISMYIFKFVISLLDTPFLYIAKKIKSKEI